MVSTHLKKNRNKKGDELTSEGTEDCFRGRKIM